MANSNKGIKINIKNDSKRRIHTSLIRFPEPEIIDEIFDVRAGEKYYRVFVNRKLNRVICNEIVSYNYKGMVLLKNPANTKAARILWQVFLEQHLRRNDRLHTIENLKNKAERLNKQEDLAVKSRKQLVGNQPSANLLRATLWCVRYHPKHLECKASTLRSAYKKFGGKTHTEDSFIKMVRKKWNEFVKEYNRQSVEFKKENSQEIYAKIKLRVPRNTRKQRIKEKKKTFSS
jgi:hypothetical protein